MEFLTRQAMFLKFADGGLAARSANGAVGFDSIAAMADVIAARVAASVEMAAYRGTSQGSETGSINGISRVNRENRSRETSLKVNTF
jgi:hypothetical protein